MPAYRFEAFDAAGRSRRGLLEAETPRAARTALRGRGLFPAQIEALSSEARPPLAGWRRRLGAARLTLLTGQLAALTQAGLTIEHALAALIEQADDARTHAMLAAVRNDIAAGASVGAALDARPADFPEFYRALVRSGEEAGALPAVLQHLADYLEARDALLSRTGLALLYPLIVTFAALLIAGGLLVYVVPQVAQAFQGAHQTLPLLTRALLATSDALREAWPWLAAVMLVAGAGTAAALRNTRLRMHWHRMLLRLPLLGGALRNAESARLASVLAILLGGGVPLLAALASAGRASGNLAVRSALEAAAERVRQGSGLAQALAAPRVFSPLLIHLTASGERTGRLAAMLERAGAMEARTLARRLAAFLTIFEPVLILALGGFVLLIVLAILLPIMEINQLVR